MLSTARNSLLTALGLCMHVRCTLHCVSRSGSRRGGLTPGGQVGKPVTAVAVSPCGNFGLVGTAAGRLDRYNMQSGLHRGCFARDGGSKTALGCTRPSGGCVAVAAHDGAVTGVRVDGCNRWLVSVGLDSAMRVWDFKRQKVSTS